MAIKKDAAKAPIKGPKKIPTKETVDTPISECEAENPMECKYHGLKAFNNYISNVTKNLGFNGSFETDKLQGNKGFQMKMPGFYSLANGFSDGLVNAAKNAGFDASYEGKDDTGQHLFLFKKEMPKHPKKKGMGGMATVKTPDEGDAVESAGKAPEQATTQGVNNLYKEISHYAQSNMDDIQAFSDKSADWKDTYEKIGKDISTYVALNNLEGLKKAFDELKEHIEKGKSILGDKQDKVGNWLDDSSLDDFLLGEEDEDAKDATPSMKDDAETDAWIEEQTKKEEEEAKKKAPSAQELFAGLDDGLDDVDEFLGGEDVIDDDELDDFLSGEGLEEEGQEGFTVEEIKAFLAKNGLTEETKHGGTPFDEVVANWKGLIEDGVSPHGAKLENQDVSVLTGFYDAAGPDDKVAQALWAKMVEKGLVDGRENIEKPTLKDYVAWAEKNYPDSSVGSEKFGTALKELVDKGTWFGGEYPEAQVDKAIEKYTKKDPNSPVTKALVAKLKELKGKKYPTQEEVKAFLKEKHGYYKTWMDDEAEKIVSIIKDGKLPKKPMNEKMASAWEDEYAYAEGDKHNPIQDALLKKLHEIQKTLDGDNGANEANAGKVPSDELESALQQLGVKESQKGAWVEAILEGVHEGNKLGEKGKEKLAAALDILSSPLLGTGAKFPNVIKQLQKVLGKESTADNEVKAMSVAPSFASSEDMLKPLEHDESKFPQNLSQEKIETAIAKGKKAGGHGGLGTTIVEIDGKKYICKNGSGKKSKIIKNGYLADMAYRAGGIHTPDAKLYEFGDGKTYKLSEFVEGKKLIDVWKNANETKRNEIRKELLKGYPLDMLFSNYDVLGTSPEESQTVTITGMDGKPQKTHVAFDNVIVGNDGNVYRIDNDGSFAMTGTGGVKSSDNTSFSQPVDFEHWDNWADRQWIDDFRTLRVNEKNAGIFDRYSTADIFLSASKVDYDTMEKVLESNPALKQALLKPLFELKQMAFYAHGAEVAGYKNQRGMSWKSSNGHLQTIECDPLSMALDAIYNGHKAGIRKFLQKKVSWMDTGWLSGSSGSSQAYVPKAFQKPEPQEPKPPTVGIDMAKEVLEGIKTIAYHAKQGDYKPNESRIKKALATKPFVEVMANAGDERAKGLLEAIGKIEESIKTGHKKALEFNTADGLFDANGLSLVVDADNSALYAKHIEPIHSKWEKEHAKWFDEKKKWDAAEMEKAKKAGAAPTKDFQSYEDMLVTANINTNGIQQGGGNPSINHESKTAQKGTSFSKKACLKKVRQYAMMGLSLDDMDFANGDKTFYNGNVANGGYHVSGGDGVENYKWAVQYYRDHPEEFKQAMQAYAVHKGMLVLCHSNMDNPAIDHNLLTCFVMRGEHKQAWGKDGKGAPTQEGIIKPYPIDSSASACINATGHFGAKKIGWKLPIWRITDNFMIGAGSEEEICINPINIPYPPMYFTDTSGGWQACMAKYNKQEAVKAIDKKLGKAEEQ